MQADQNVTRQTLTDQAEDILLGLVVLRRKLHEVQKAYEAQGLLEVLTGCPIDNKFLADAYRRQRERAAKKQAGRP